MACHKKFTISDIVVGISIVLLLIIIFPKFFTWILNNVITK